MTFHDPNRNIMSHLMLKAMSLGLDVEIVTRKEELVIGPVNGVRRAGPSLLYFAVGNRWVWLDDITGISKHERAA